MGKLISPEHVNSVFCSRLLYTADMIRIHHTKTVLAALFDVVVAFIRFLVEFIHEAFLLLFGGTEGSSIDSKTENSARGGTLNYRTGQFDDGTDASGWYEKD